MPTDGIQRTDHLKIVDLNDEKSRLLRELVLAFRRNAENVAADQWKRFYMTGRFSSFLTVQQEAESEKILQAKADLGSQRHQMLRTNVVGTLKSFMSNRANEFRDIVKASTLDNVTKHELNRINQLQAWYRPDPVYIGPEGAEREIPASSRDLARRMIKNILKRHRRPTFKRINPWFDQRQARFEVANGRATNPLASHWLRLNVNEKRRTKAGNLSRQDKKVWLPVQSHDYHDARKGERAKSVQLIMHEPPGQPPEFKLGIMTNVSETYMKSRNDYEPRTPEIALDLGLATMIATDRGDLFGGNWVKQLEKHNRRIAGLAAELQRQGKKPSNSKRYQKRVTALRGYLRTEIGRVLHRIVKVHAPASIIIEKLDFRAPGLTPKLNRLLARMGHAILEEKLNDLTDRFGIVWQEVNPAYSSQTCSSCGHVARNNRTSQDTFQCRSCGHDVNADVNAARNLRSGRSAFDRVEVIGKRDALHLTAIRHLERIGVPVSQGRVVSDCSKWPTKTLAWVSGRPKVYERGRGYSDLLAPVCEQLAAQRQSAPLASS